MSLESYCRIPSMSGQFLFYHDNEAIHCEQGKSEGFDSWDRPCNLKLGLKLSIFQPV